MLTIIYGHEVEKTQVLLHFSNRFMMLKSSIEFSKSDSHSSNDDNVMRSAF